jgi:acylphosphatase
MTGNDLSRIHAVIKGRVQGVGFRAFVYREANDIGLTGWVRNRWDGNVEVMAEGQRSALDRLIITLKRGPSSAMVSTLDVDWQTGTGEFKHFSVKSTR